MPNRHLVTGVDGSPCSTAAAHWAAEEALRRDLPLRVVHARPLQPLLLPQCSWLPPSAPDLLHGMESALVRSHPGLEVSCVEVLDTATSALVAASEDAELLVLGSRGSGGFAELLLGSVGLHCAARSHCPVVTVRPSDPAKEDAGASAEVMVGVDARDPDEAALDFAFEAAQRRGARLRAIHAWPAPVLRGVADAGWAGEELELLEEALGIRRKEYPGVEVLAEALPGAPAGVLVHAAPSADLLVVGRRRSGDRLPARLGPVAHAVLHHVGTTVAVVPNN